MVLHEELAKAQDVYHNHDVTISSDELRYLIAYTLGVGQCQGREPKDETASDTVNWILSTYR